MCVAQAIVCFFFSIYLQLLRNSDGSEVNLIKELVEGEISAITPSKEAAVESLAVATVSEATMIQKDKELADKDRQV